MTSKVDLGSLTAQMGDLITRFGAFETETRARLDETATSIQDMNTSVIDLNDRIGKLERAVFSNSEGDTPQASALSPSLVNKDATPKPMSASSNSSTSTPKKRVLVKFLGGEESSKRKALCQAFEKVVNGSLPEDSHVTLHTKQDQSSGKELGFMAVFIRGSSRCEDSLLRNVPKFTELLKSSGLAPGGNVNQSDKLLIVLYGVNDEEIEALKVAYSGTKDTYLPASCRNSHSEFVKCHSARIAPLTTLETPTMSLNKSGLVKSTAERASLILKGAFKALYR